MTKDVAGTETGDQKVEYTYCPSCGGAMRERIEYEYLSGWVVKSWLRYEYDGLNLLRIDERYDDEVTPDGIDSGDPWRPMNIYVHAPGAIGQIIKAKWFNYKDCTTSPCDSGWYYYFYDAVGNVVGVIDQNTHEFIEYEMDAFGNDLPGGTSFLAMDQPGPKEHLTGKMFDTVTGLYYFMARWYDPEVGRFVSRDKASNVSETLYSFVKGDPMLFIDPSGDEEEIPNFGLNIPTYVTMKRKGNCGPIGNCKCEKKHLVDLINRKSREHEMWIYHYDHFMGKPAERPVGGDTYAALTGCRGTALLGEATIWWVHPTGLECIDKCMLKHELIHAEQCHEHGAAIYLDARYEDFFEYPAYMESVKCLQDEIDKLKSPEAGK